ncbi:L-threonylcarbamoyladenylate synthase [Polynucleobacter rarus]|uniref:L-threonylcarbamoyladenylate synthase n=1 Tax=Polynucleobacter rarus TaxID=556055 RepID=UPI000D3E20BD|nr:L-threonylcarbamoyladenylate synthase [Polynucleobacter rarus]
MNIEIIGYTSIDISKSVDHLKHDGLIGFPTETVYGLGARADHPKAVEKIFQLKGRPSNHPLIVHIPPAKENTDFHWLNQFEPWARDIPNEALRLAQAFWPGPLTMILQKAKGVIKEVTGGNETVGLRCPNQKTAIEILKELGTGIAAPSANRFGKISPTNAQHVYEEFSPITRSFSNEFDLVIVDAGDCEIGIESTIIDLTNIDTHGLRILRPGMITVKDIEDKTGLLVGKVIDKLVAHSGSHLAHYAPMTPLKIIEQPLVGMVFEQNENSIWLSMMDEDLTSLQNIQVRPIPSNPKDLAKIIYGLLRELDKKSYQTIYIRALPLDSQWDAIRDRLKRAAKGSGKS